MRWWLLLVVAGLGYGGLATWVKQMPRPVESEDMRVSAAIPAQLLLAGGDRFLAANLAVFRAVMLRSDRAVPEAIPVLAAVQRDAAWMNPGHADNYYSAAAILAWQNEVPSAQYVLERAIAARRGDLMPSFFYAFNLFHFEKQPQAGAQALLDAADRAASEEDQLSLRDLAARWLTREPDGRAAVMMVRKMAAQSRHAGFRRYLESRALRMEGLERLREAHGQFVQRFGRPPAYLAELVERKVIDRLPDDPTKAGYALDASGVPVYKRHAAVPQEK